MNDEKEVLGELTDEEVALLTKLQAEADLRYNQIGQLEVRKAMLISEIGAAERKGQQAMYSISERLEIPQGTRWQIDKDKKVFKLT